MIFFDSPTFQYPEGKILIVARLLPPRMVVCERFNTPKGRYSLWQPPLGGLDFTGFEGCVLQTPPYFLEFKRFAKPP